MLILRRFGPFFCSLKRVHADIFMLACTLFNEQNKGPILLSIITWFILGKQNVQVKNVNLLNKLTNSTLPSNSWLKHQSRDYFPRHSGVQRRKIKKRTILDIKTHYKWMVVIECNVKCWCFNPYTMWALALRMEMGPHKDRGKLWPGWDLNPSLPFILNISATRPCVANAT